MKRTLILSLILSLFLIAPVSAAQIVAETPITYSDGRPSPSWRLPAVDDSVVLNYNNNSSDIKGARDAFIYEENGTYYMTYDGVGQNNWTVNEATSTDLINWTALGKKLDIGPAGKPDSAAAAYGTIFKEPSDSAYYMFYLGANTKTGQPTNTPLPNYVSLRAKGPSATGPWSKQSATPIIPLVNGSYREVTASPGPIIKSGNYYYMYFSAAAEHLGKYYRGIGLAWTTNLNSTTWTVGSGPIISIYEQVENASLYYENGIWYMFVNHVGINSSSEETTDQVWVYWSTNPFDWNADNKAVVMDETVSTWSTDGVIGIPSVVKVGDELKMIYDGRSELDPLNIMNNIYRDIGLSTIDLPIQLP